LRILPILLILIIFESCHSNDVVVLFENTKDSLADITAYVNSNIYKDELIKQTKVADIFEADTFKNIIQSRVTYLKFVINQDTTSCSIIKDSITKNTVVIVSYNNDNFFSEVMYEGINPDK
jgi:hypothetical protein